MVTKKIFAIANWKMNPATLKEAENLFIGVKKFSKKYSSTIILCTPFSYLSSFTLKTTKNLFIGAQNLSSEKKGAFTGEVAASSLSSLRVPYVILGHSERRKVGETSKMVSDKIARALENKITPIVCVGEKERDTEGHFFNVIKHELLETLSGVSKKNICKVIVAYEPLWAISTEGKGAMDPNLIHETVLFIKKVLSDKFGKNTVSKIKIVYGGSVSGDDAKDVITIGTCDGVLVGHASLNAKSFEKIVSAVS